MILVIVVILTLVIDLNPEPKTSSLKLIFIVEALHNFQRTSAIIVPHHGELVSSKTRTLNDFVMEFVRFILIMDSDSQNRSVWKQISVGFVNLRNPFLLGKTRRHVVDVFDFNRGRSRAFQTSAIHGNHLNRVIGSLFAIKATNCSLDDSGLLFNFENGCSRMFVNDILFNGVFQFGIGTFLGIIVIDGRHSHYHHSGSAIFRDIAIIDALREKGCIVVDILEVDLNIGITN